jgi:lysophospholipase L1-like esterase
VNALMLVFWIIVIGLGGLLLAGIVQRRSAGLRQLAAGLLVSYGTLLLILLGAEVYFRFIHAESSNIITFDTQNWLDRYWHTNSWGYRDHEWLPQDYAGKSTVVVLGDSFAAGWGLENPADRFSDVLAARLGDDYAVFNAAEYGTATAEQLENLRTFPIQQPDVVILQYFLNDINYTGLRLGLLPQPEVTPDWSRATFLGNFLYWRVVVNATSDASLYNRWWQWSYDAYDNVGIWSEHRAEIESFIDYTESIDARLIVVIFPNLLEIVRSIPYVDRVAQVFMERGHPDVLRLFDAAAGWDPEDLLVSRRDSHASASFNRSIGEQLYALYFQPDQP